MKCFIANGTCILKSVAVFDGSLFAYSGSIHLSQEKVPARLQVLRHVITEGRNNTLSLDTGDDTCHVA